VLSLNSAVVITCELLMTKVTQRWPARVVALVGFVLLGVGQALYSVPAGLVVFIGGTLVWTLAEITAGPTMSAYPANAGPERLRSQYLGASQSVFALLGRPDSRRAGLASGRPAGVVVVWRGVARRPGGRLARHAAGRTRGGRRRAGRGLGSRARRCFGCGARNCA
jgi:hypothetical protein